MIKIIDYGMGNLKSVAKGFEKVGYQVEITNDPQEILAARGVVLPGVGAFSDAMNNLRELELIEPIQKVIEQGVPFLGICLGLQLLFSESEEFGLTKGLDIIPGTVKKFPTDLGLKIPHIGWNQLKIEQKTEIYQGLEEGVFQYFVHSYYVEPDDDEVIATVTDYGLEFVSSIAQDNIYAVQFHPEKSSQDGLQILNNFGALVKS
ncbi:imidazole glycerol phosphate synthase, glutamine amidotransferase subunit [Halobacteroides halobius DSM 5150]|uniref:Imidazole glycerol phosphate synthase subunit HisH n=1 Tax=Halobacteroides halobius (strain ATCC 35273 / DSM 5150 / MD-1) TaxID=748449 RepID=L0KA25_HALHC|nr:imidazole glycerol phosphate synthase subunit HisH [Halobacteroides halobius]AGB40953.1 imidazole glycerol phosphate synthase, glutamine amidotransferase subunit [Halobacteroides halobius DSM 5150]